MGAEGLPQGFPHLFGMRTLHRSQHDQIAAMIVDHRQRPHLPIPQLRTFKVHLPQLVGRTPFEALQGGGMAVLGRNQIVPQQNAMNRIAPQFDPFSLQQHSQLSRPPLGIAPPQLQHPLLLRPFGSSRTLLRTPAAFRDSLHSALTIALQPLVTHRPRNPELLAQSHHRLLPPMSRHYEPYPLLLYVHRLPGHPSLSSAPSARWRV